MKRLAYVLKVLGFVTLAAGVIIGFGDLQGWFRYSEREAFVRWVQESQVGMPTEDPAAQAFMRRFPPPEDARSEQITHVTKHVMRLENGGVLQASINYMHRDHSRTRYVATLPEIREWASETLYCSPERQDTLTRESRYA